MRSHTVRSSTFAHTEQSAVDLYCSATVCVSWANWCYQQLNPIAFLAHSLIHLFSHSLPRPLLLYSAVSLAVQNATSRALCHTALAVDEFVCALFALFVCLRQSQPFWCAYIYFAVSLSHLGGGGDDR